MATGKRSEEGASCFICMNKGHKMAQCFYNPNSSNYKSTLKPSKMIIQNLKKRNLMRNENDTGSGDECEFAFLAGQSPEISRRWFLDSCASRHIVNQRELMFNYRSLDKEESVNAAAEGALVRIVGIGSVRVRQDIDGKEYVFVLHDVGYAPKCRTNSVALACAKRKGVAIVFEPGTTTIKGMKNGHVVMVGDIANMGITELTGLRAVRSGSTNIAFYNAVENDAMELAHRRTFHTAVGTLREMERKGDVNGLDALKSAKKVEILCEVCVDGKAAEVPHPKHERGTQEVLALLHTDLSGPTKPARNWW